MFLTLTAAIEREFELVRQNDVVRGGEYFFLPGLRSLERLVKTPAQR